MLKGLGGVVLGLYAVLVQPDYSKAQQSQKELPVIYILGVDEILMGSRFTNICYNIEEMLKPKEAKDNVVLFIYDRGEESKAMALGLKRAVEELPKDKGFKLFKLDASCENSRALQSQLNLAEVPSISAYKYGKEAYRITRPPASTHREVTDMWGRMVGRNITLN